MGFFVQKSNRLSKKNSYFSVALLKEKFDKLVKFIKKEFKVSWNFQRIEIQNRGSLHLHSLFKINNAPDSEKLISEIIKFEIEREKRKERSQPLFRNIEEARSFIKMKLRTKEYSGFYNTIISESIPDSFYSDDNPDFDKTLHSYLTPFHLKGYPSYVLLFSIINVLLIV